MELSVGCRSLNTSQSSWQNPVTIITLLYAGTAIEQVDIFKYLGVPMHGTKGLTPGRKEGRFTHPWQPARLIGWNSVWVGQCDISAMTSCQGRL